MTPESVPLFCVTNYFCDLSGVTTPTSAFGDKLVDFTSADFIEQHDPPSFLALAVEQLPLSADFDAVEHSLEDFDAVEQWSSEAFFAAVFVAQHEEPAFDFDVEQDSPLPANAKEAVAKRATANVSAKRIFMMNSFYGLVDMWISLR